MAFIRYTANPKRETTDCIIRSVAHATDTPWETVMREFCDIAISLYQMPNNFEVAAEYMDKHNYPEGYVHPNNKPTVIEFTEKHPTGKYVVLLEDHAMSVVDGDYYDLTDCGSCKVVDYWTIQ